MVRGASQTPTMPDIVTFPAQHPILAPLAGENLAYSIVEAESGERLDRFAAAKTGLSRTLMRELIDFGSVWVNGEACRRQSRALKTDDLVNVFPPIYGPVRYYEIDPSRILYRDDWLLAYNKEAGVPSQQTPYDGYNHLFGGLKRYLGDAYLGLHHRLDAATSGVMVFTLSQKANLKFGKAFIGRAVRKVYLAVAHGVPQEKQWTVDLPVSRSKGGYCCAADGIGKSAVTEFVLLDEREGGVLLEARPLTGRTHQIRLHLKASGIPIVGDERYGGPPAARLMLHALSLTFDHPVTGQSLTIEAPRPEGF